VILLIFVNYILQMNCTICLESLQTYSQSVVVTSCLTGKHMFHKECLNQWYRTSQNKNNFVLLPHIPHPWLGPFKCPVCNHNVTEIYEDQKLVTLDVSQYEPQNDEIGPYRLQPQAIVYYYEERRQPGGSKAGNVGRLLSTDINDFLHITPLLPFDSKTKIDVVHTSRVFDILFLVSGIPTRSEVNKFSEPGTSLMTEHVSLAAACQSDIYDTNLLRYQSMLHSTLTDRKWITKLNQMIRNHIHCTASSLVSVESLSVKCNTFLNKYVYPEIGLLPETSNVVPKISFWHGDITATMKQLPEFSPYHIRIILSYLHLGLVPDQTDTEKLRKIISVSKIPNRKLYLEYPYTTTSHICLDPILYTNILNHWCYVLKNGEYFQVHNINARSFLATEPTTLAADNIEFMDDIYDGLPLYRIVPGCELLRTPAFAVLNFLLSSVWNEQLPTTPCLQMLTAKIHLITGIPVQSIETYLPHVVRTWVQEKDILLPFTPILYLSGFLQHDLLLAIRKLHGYPRGVLGRKNVEQVRRKFIDDRKGSVRGE
jgi:hypothetical protein